MAEHPFFICTKCREKVWWIWVNTKGEGYWGGCSCHKKNINFEKNKKHSFLEDKNTQSGGIGFSGALTLIFIVLKLCKVIDWSWWWVLSPIWIILAVITIIFLFMLINIFLK